MKRKILSIVLALAMIVSLVPATVFAESGGETIKYVSLGDSMTNGYGLPGYDGDTGVEDYGTASYANQFAAWLGENTEHARLAMSAMRAEDLHWLLELDYNDPEAIALTEAEPKDDGYSNAKLWWEEVHADRWYAKFSNGDFWTWDQLCDDYRLARAAYAIKNDGAIGNITVEEAKIVAEHYQTAVKNADVVSLGMGNGNFGVFMFGRLLEAVGFGGKPEDTLVYDMEDALQEVKKFDQQNGTNLYAEVEKLIAEVENLVENYTGADLQSNLQLAALLNTVLYTGVSFLINYAGSVEAILKLNPDAEIILVELMNTFEDNAQSAALMSAAGAASLSLGELMGMVYEPLNAFIAALPFYLQFADGGAYGDAVFYYARLDGKVECLVDVYGDDFYLDEAKTTPNPNSTIRKRFVENIVGSASNPGMVWGLMGGVELVEGMTLCPVTFEEVLAYDVMSDAQKAAYAAANTQKAVSVAVYLAFEDACIKASKGTPISLESVLGLGGLGFELFNPVLGDFSAKIGVNAGAYAETATSIAVGIAAVQLADGVNSQMGAAVLDVNSAAQLIAAPDLDSAVGGLVKQIMVQDARVSAAIRLYHTDIDELLACTNTAHPFCGTIRGEFNNYKEALKSGVQTAKDAATDVVPMLCMLLALPDTLSQSLQTADPTVAGLLALFARCVIGNGIGCHPSVAGHNALFEAVKEAYDEVYTSQQKTIENILALISEYYDEAYSFIYDAVLGEDDAEDYVIDADSYLVALGDAAAYGPAVKQLSEKLGVKYADLTASNVTAADVVAKLPGYAAEIAKADLITLGFSPNAFMSFAGKQAKAAMTGKAVAEMDWVALVGEEAAALIAAELEKLSESIADGGIPAQYAAIVSVAVESYAFAYVAHLLGYVELAESIRAINSDVVLMLTGMYNPMEGLVIDLNGEALDLGKYIGYIVDLANLGTLGYAVYADDTVYADAPDVETGFEGKTVGAVNFVVELLSFDKTSAKYAPTEAGYAYIAQQMYDALNPIVADDKEEDKDDEEVVPHVHGAPKSGVKFTWTADHSACEASYVCAGCGETLTAKCKVATETKQPTVDAEGLVKHTATVEIAGKTYSDEQTEVLAKLPAPETPETPEKPESPETGDGMMSGLYVAVMLVAAAGAIVVLKKKKHA